MRYRLYLDNSAQSKEIRAEFDNLGIKYVLMYSREIAIEGDFFIIKGFEDIRKYLFGPKRIIK